MPSTGSISNFRVVMLLSAKSTIVELKLDSDMEYLLDHLLLMKARPL